MGYSCKLQVIKPAWHNVKWSRTARVVYSFDSYFLGIVSAKVCCWILKLYEKVLIPALLNCMN